MINVSGLVQQKQMEAEASGTTVVEVRRLMRQGRQLPSDFGRSRDEVPVLLAPDLPAAVLRLSPPHRPTARARRTPGVWGRSRSEAHAAASASAYLGSAVVATISDIARTGPADAGIEIRGDALLRLHQHGAPRHGAVGHQPRRDVRVARPHCEGRCIRPYFAGPGPDSPRTLPGHPALAWTPPRHLRRGANMPGAVLPTRWNAAATAAMDGQRREVDISRHPAIAVRRARGVLDGNMALGASASREESGTSITWMPVSAASSVAPSDQMSSRRSGWFAHRPLRRLVPQGARAAGQTTPVEVEGQIEIQQANLIGGR